MLARNAWWCVERPLCLHVVVRAQSQSSLTADWYSNLGKPEAALMFWVNCQNVFHSFSVDQQILPLGQFQIRPIVCKSSIHHKIVTVSYTVNACNRGSVTNLHTTTRWQSGSNIQNSSDHLTF